MSPRKNPRRAVQPARAPLGPERIEQWPDGDWVVRPVPGAAATKTYRCPGCDQEIVPGTAHLVVWPTHAPGVTERRHWHTTCWRRRLTRRPGRLVQRDWIIMTEIRAATVLPARRTDIELHTADGLRLVGELALPVDREPSATLIWLHPLPTHGGMMDSHLLRKASYRLPALAGLAVLRFNTRGTSSDRGKSEGAFDGGDDERLDVAAAVDFAGSHGLANLWLVGWSFGTELALKWGSEDPRVVGAVLLSPPLKRAGDDDLDRWARSGKPLTVLVPELDDYLRPDEARQRFARVPKATLIGVENAKHLWVGEPYVRIVLNEIVRTVAPTVPLPLPTEM